MIKGCYIKDYEVSDFVDRDSTPWNQSVIWQCLIRTILEMILLLFNAPSFHLCHLSQYHWMLTYNDFVNILSLPVRCVVNVSDVRLSDGWKILTNSILYPEKLFLSRTYNSVCSHILFHDCPCVQLLATQRSSWTDVLLCERVACTKRSLTCLLLECINSSMIRILPHVTFVASAVTSETLRCTVNVSNPSGKNSQSTTRSLIVPLLGRTSPVSQYVCGCRFFVIFLDLERYSRGPLRKMYKKNFGWNLTAIQGRQWTRTKFSVFLGRNPFTHCWPDGAFDLSAMFFAVFLKWDFHLLDKEHGNEELEAVNLCLFALTSEHCPMTGTVPLRLTLKPCFVTQHLHWYCGIYSAISLLRTLRSGDQQSMNEQRWSCSLYVASYLNPCFAMCNPEMFLPSNSLLKNALQCTLPLILFRKTCTVGRCLTLCNSTQIGRRN